MVQNVRSYSLLYSSLLWLCIVLVACHKEIQPTDNPPKPEIIETQPPVLKAVFERINAVIGGFYSGLPARYNESAKTYPLLVFIHGAGQFGDGSFSLPNVLNEGIPKLLNEKKFPPNFKVGGSNYSFIVLAPQFSRYPTTDEIKSLVDYAKNKYRVDSRRIFLTGFSIGGVVTADAGAAYPLQFAAIVPMSGVSSSSSNLAEKCQSIAFGRLPVWVFHNDDDATIPSSEAKKFISYINGFAPAIPPKFTLWPSGGHNSWTKASDPDYKENNMNIYEWMLQFNR